MNFQKMKQLGLALVTLMTLACGSEPPSGSGTNAPEETLAADTFALQADIITDTVDFDTDDPAIWIHPSDKSKSLIIGTDKEVGGGIYAFDLNGKVVHKVTGLQRPNNVDIAYGLKFGDSLVDIAVVTERKANTIRVFTLPDLVAIDNGGIPVFEGETCEECREGMGIALYTDPATGSIQAVVGRKNGSDGSYLWQYELKANEQGKVTGTVLRKFGRYSGKKEIEAIAVDNELGYIYYADETEGIRKYYADPAKGDKELALFGQQDFQRDHEGISIFKAKDSKGYIIVSDQQAHGFNVYPREGIAGDPHKHDLITKVPTGTRESDGSDVVNIALNGQFPEGLFVAMDERKTFHFYDWRTFQKRIDQARAEKK